jgi:hypothetical protein
MKKLNSELSETQNTPQDSSPEASLISQTNSDEYVDYPIKSLELFKNMDFS